MREQEEGHKVIPCARDISGIEVQDSCLYGMGWKPSPGPDF